MSSPTTCSAMSTAACLSSSDCALLLVHYRVVWHPHHNSTPPPISERARQQRSLSLCMPSFKRRQQQWKCVVLECQCSWMATQVGKFCFREDHAPGATQLYHQYKKMTDEGTTNFDADILKEAASLRETYGQTYLAKYVDEKHTVFIRMLRYVATLDCAEQRRKTWIALLQTFLDRDYARLPC